MNTRKYPRTQNEAFGPYGHLGPIEPIPTRTDRFFDFMTKILATIGAAVVILLIAAILIVQDFKEPPKPITPAKCGSCKLGTNK